MKFKKLLSFVFFNLFIVFANLVKAETTDHEHSHQGEHEQIAYLNVGPGKAVTAASEEFGFRLSPSAQKNLGLQYITLTSLHPQSIPQSALVFYQDHQGLYRYQEDWFKLVSQTDLKIGDLVVIQGNGLLRVTDVSIFGDQETGHVH